MMGSYSVTSIEIMEGCTVKITISLLYLSNSVQDENPYFSLLEHILRREKPSLSHYDSDQIGLFISQHHSKLYKLYKLYMSSLRGEESTVIIHLQNNRGDYFFPYTASKQPSWNKVFPANFRLWTPDIEGTLFKRIDYMYVPGGCNGK